MKNYSSGSVMKDRKTSLKGRRIRNGKQKQTEKNSQQQHRGEREQYLDERCAKSLFEKLPGLSIFEDINEPETCVDVLLIRPDCLMPTCLKCCGCPELTNAARGGSDNTFYALLLKRSLPQLMEQEIKLVENFCFSKIQVSNQVKKQVPRKKILKSQ